MSNNPNIVGVLALQGAVLEHTQQLELLGVKAIAIKQASQLTNIDALVIPGGESTAIGNLMRKNEFIDAIKSFAQQGKPIFGTCAGMILLAKNIKNENISHLGLMDIEVTRNAFGRQVDSFQIDLEVKGFTSSFPAIFIRAPLIDKILNPRDVEILASYKNKVVLAKQNNLLVASFHPELTKDVRIMQLLLDMIK